LHFILASFLFTSCMALYVDQAHHGAQHGGDECSTSPQTECWDVEKPQVEQKTERKCNTLFKKECKPVQKSLQKTIYEDKCKTVNDENCVTVYDPKCEVKQQAQCVVD